MHPSTRDYGITFFLKVKALKKTSRLRYSVGHSVETMTKYVDYPHYIFSIFLVKKNRPIKRYGLNKNTVIKKFQRKHPY